MDDQENDVRVTRPSKKRPFASADTPNQSLQQQPGTKKRVPLGDLTNSADAGSIRNSGFGGTQKRKPNLTTTEEEVRELARPEIFVSSDDGEKCQDAPLMDQSLRSLEESELSDLENVASSDDLQKCEGAHLIYQNLCSSEESADLEIVASSEVQKGEDAPLIYQNLRSLEVEEKRRPLADYMEKVQKDVNRYMRDVLLDWLVEVAEEYKLVSDTLYLTVTYIDRFLSQHSVSRNKLQLVGVSCMLVASKYEEISPPHVEDFCYITDNTYTKEEVLKMERDVLIFLNYEMGTPTIKTFLRIFSRGAQENSKVSKLQLEFLGSYLAEISLLDYECLQFLPSMVAASAMFLSRFIIQPKTHPWTLALQRYSGYRPSELKECVLAIHGLQLSRRGLALQAVRDKYMGHKFKSVAALSSPSEIPSSYFEACKE